MTQEGKERALQSDSSFFRMAKPIFVPKFFLQKTRVPSRVLSIFFRDSRKEFRGFASGLRRSRMPRGHLRGLSLLLLLFL